MPHKRRRVLFVVLLALIVSVLSSYQNDFQAAEINQPSSQIKNVTTTPPEESEKAAEILNSLPIKGRAPKTGYERELFLDDWRKENNCDKRNIILQRDLSDTKLDKSACIVESGKLNDPYTGKQTNFIRGFGTSDDIQIDHVVSLSDAWQKGAQQLSPDRRNNFANDPLNLLAVDGPINMQKSDSDAVSWLPPNKTYRCMFVARQIAVKAKYNLWLTAAEKTAMNGVLKKCPDQVLPSTEIVHSLTSSFSLRHMLHLIQKVYQ